MMRYNIALLSTGHPKAYTEAARAFFLDYAVGYLLGPSSLPHVTICQFMAKPSSLPMLMDRLAAYHEKSPLLELTGLRFSDKRGHPTLWGVSLSVARTPGLMALHRFVVSLLGEYGLTPLNAIEDLYTPHLTLARVNRLCADGFSKDLFKQDRFELVLGESDQLGQLTQVVRIL